MRMVIIPSLQTICPADFMITSLQSPAITLSFVGTSSYNIVLAKQLLAVAYKAHQRVRQQYHSGAGARLQFLSNAGMLPTAMEMHPMLQITLLRLKDLYHLGVGKDVTCRMIATRLEQ
jgi:hypothetical protein